MRGCFLRYAKEVWRRWWLIVPQWVIGVLGLSGKISAQSWHIPSWGWVIIIVSGVMVAQAWAYYGLWKKIQTNGNNWIVAYEIRCGKPPPAPDYFIPMLDNYIEKEPLSTKVKYKRPSHQYWHGLIDENKERFLQLIDWLGGDRYEFLQNIRDTAPPGDGKPFILKRKVQNEIRE